MGLKAFDLLDPRVVREYLAVDLCLADPPRDELGVLGAEIEDQDAFAVNVRHEKTPFQKKMVHCIAGCRCLSIGDSAGEDGRGRERGCRPCSSRLTFSMLSDYYPAMSTAVYHRLQEKAMAMARSLPRPAFYERHAPLLRRSEEALAGNALIKQCRAVLEDAQLECAHGVCHCEAVARDAGVIVLAEAAALNLGAADTEILFINAIIAGLLHDIKRKEDDHAVRGSIESERILSRIGMGLRERQHIADAIRNHEAFQETVDRDDAAGRLVSDALYDADKFRWGPENFSVTLWLMVTARDTPLASLHGSFRENMKGIEKIKETFRTAVGKRYGPEFIDQGIEIGNAIYEEMSALLRAGL